MRWNVTFSLDNPANGGDNGPVSSSNTGNELSGRSQTPRFYVALPNARLRFYACAASIILSSQAMQLLSRWRVLMGVRGMHREASIEIQVSPDAVYALVSDLPRRVWGSGAPRTSAVGGKTAGAAKWTTASSATIGRASGYGQCR